MSAIAATGTLECVFKSVSYEHGVHAAFHGSSWDRDAVAVVITSMGPDLGSTFSVNPSSMTLHFDVRSDSRNVMEQIRGQEEELLAVLTGGLAVPAPRPTDGTGSILVPSAAEIGRKPDADGAPAAQTTTSDSYTFLTGSVTSRNFAAAVEEGGPGALSASALEEPEDLPPEKALRLAHELEDAAVDEWRRLRASRLAVLSSAWDPDRA